MHHPTDRIAHTSLCYTSRGALGGMKNSAMGSLFNGDLKEGNDLFNDALNTFYSQLCDGRHMIKNYSYSRGSRMFSNFTFPKAIGLKIHWPICKLHCKLF